MNTKIFHIQKKISKLLLIVFVLTGCLPERDAVPARQCDVKSIILDESVFKGNLEFGPISSPSPDASPESASREFYFNVEEGIVTDHAIQIVERYRYLEDAIEEFNEIDRALFESAWSTPSELGGLQLSADEYHLACGQELSEPICRFVARYAEYVLYFTSDISSEGMTLNTFSNSINEIDFRVAQCFGG